ncbi:hypothetical protein ACFL60_01525 [Candidatus Omnitrophota bacterium]
MNRLPYAVTHLLIPLEMEDLAYNVWTLKSGQSFLLPLCRGERETERVSQGSELFNKKTSILIQNSTIRRE